MPRRLLTVILADITISYNDLLAVTYCVLTTSSHLLLIVSLYFLLIELLCYVNEFSRFIVTETKLRYSVILCWLHNKMFFSGLVSLLLCLATMVCAFYVCIFVYSIGLLQFD